MAAAGNSAHGAARGAHGRRPLAAPQQARQAQRGAAPPVHHLLPRLPPGTPQVANARRIAEWLAAHPMVHRVNYPGLASHPGRDVHERQVRARLGRQGGERGAGG